MAAKLAIWDEGDSYVDNSYQEKLDIAESEYTELKVDAEKIALEKGWNKVDVLASKVYAQFATGSKASKSIAAQYLALILEEKFKDSKPDLIRKMLPEYLVSAIDHVTGGKPKAEQANG